MWGLIRGATSWTLMYMGAKAVYEHARRRVKPDRVYTQKEVARLLRVPVEEAVELIESRQIPGQRIGEEYRVTGDSVIQFLNARAVVREVAAPSHA